MLHVSEQLVNGNRGHRSRRAARLSPAVNSNARIPLVQRVSALQTRQMQPAEDLRELLGTELRSAMSERDRIAVTALRCAIAALDNAEAVDVAEVADHSQLTAGEHVAGARGGLGAAEFPRRVLSASQQIAVVINEISDRRSAADTHERRGARESAIRLRMEAAVLEQTLGLARGRRTGGGR